MAITSNISAATAAGPYEPTPALDHTTVANVSKPVGRRNNVTGNS